LIDGLEIKVTFALQAGVIQGTTLSAEDKVAADKLGLPLLVDVRKLGVEFVGADIVATRRNSAQHAAQKVF
jgi:hypothetical protein